MKNESSSKQSKKKPKPLFSLFRKSKPAPVDESARQDLPTPRQPPASDDGNHRHHHQQQWQGRPRAISSAAATTRPMLLTDQQRLAQRARSLIAREQALNKLCGHSSSPGSGIRSLQQRPPPPVPTYYRQHSPISPRFPQRTTPPSSPAPLRKASSAYDLQKAARHHHHAIHHCQQPIPISTHHYRYPNSPGYATNKDDDDDDLPLAAVASPKTTPTASLLMQDDSEEEDDKDLVPIASLATGHPSGQFLSAADKYKEKVKERLKMGIDDDEVPIVPQRKHVDDEAFCLPQAVQ